MTVARHPWARLCRDELADWRELLPRLTAEQWGAPSLCEGFTVADVVGHMTSARDIPLRSVLWQLAHHRFDLDRLSYAASRRYAADLGPDGMTATFAHATSRWPEPGLARVEPARRELADALTHRLDICRPLGIAVDVPAVRMTAVLDAVVTLPDWGCRRTARGLRLRADDLDWSHGSGPEVRGPAQALLLGIGRRPAALAELAGPGLETLAARVDGRRRTPA
jgi:uncharacterized protein (TIGR03083 family)